MSAPQKTVEVDPAEEGPKVKAKRQMTEAQLAALKKGREKLAEKRKQNAQESQITAVEVEARDADASVSANAPVQKDPVDHVWDTQKEDDDVEEGYAPLCTIM